MNTTRYFDTSFVGSEDYYYRVKAYLEDAPTSYSPEDYVHAVPRWPENFAGVTVKYNPGTQKKSVARKDVPGESPYEYPTNMVRLSWSPPVNQKTPIDHYEIQVTEYGFPWYPTFYTTEGTSLEICSLKTEKIYFFDIASYDSIGYWSNWDYRWVSLYTGWIDHCGWYEPDPVIQKTAERALETELRDCYPNPFNASTAVSFSLAGDADVLLEVYNILGQRVRSLVDDHLPSGSYQYQWRGEDQSGSETGSGIYFVRLQTGDFQEVRKVMLVK